MEEALANLERRAYRTYKSRLEAHRRLSTRGTAWNVALVSVSTALTIGSVGILVDQSIYGEKGEVLLACLSVLSLAASLVVANMNYGVRSSAMETNYKRFQKISKDVERRAVLDDAAREQMLTEYARESDLLVEASENHTSADFYRAFPEGQQWSKVVGERTLSLIPYASVLIALAMLLPFLGWLS
ncbi:SLATT domain-containing protein [Intrasporangium mesophilum]